MAFYKHKLAKATALLAAILVVAALAVPWKRWLASALVTQFEAQGFENVHLTIASLGIQTIELEKLSVGQDPPLTLNHLTLHYSLLDLWNGNLKDISVKGLSLQAQQSQSGWTLGGLSSLSSKNSKESSTAIPVTLGELDSAIPLDAATLEDSHLHLATSSWNMDIPLHITWQKSPLPRLSYQASGLELRWQDMIVHSGDTTFDATLNTSEKQWEGKWQSKDIILQGMAGEVPPLSAKGKINANEKMLTISGDLGSIDKRYHASFRLNYNTNTKESSRFLLQSATIPWGGGTLSLRDVSIALGEAKPIRLNLEVRDVSVDALLQMATSNKATATGTVSGTIPVSVAPDGAIRFLQGSLRAKEAGTIIMAPDAIPGDNQQITLVRDVLKNLHYKVLSVGVNSSTNNKQAILLSVEGNNPDVYAGRPVKLNVQLNGDVLNLIQQSVMPFTNPKQLLK